MRHPAKGMAILVVLLLALSAHESGRAQTAPPSTSWWGTAGLGLGGDDASVGFLGASYQDRNVMLSARVTLNRGPLGGDDINDFGLVYCVPIGTERLNLSAGIGVGGIWGSRGLGSSGPFGEKLPFTVGLPFELQAFWRPARFFGIGGYGFANVNSLKTILGAGLGVQCGRFW